MFCSWIVAEDDNEDIESYVSGDKNNSSYNIKSKLFVPSSDGDDDTNSKKTQKFSQEEDFLQYMAENNKEIEYEQVRIETVSFIEYPTLLPEGISDSI